MICEENIITVEVAGLIFGDGKAKFIAGPCAVESEEQIYNLAKELKKCGVDILRGGCFKPRTSPYSFQGLGEEGLHYLNEAGKFYGLPIISEFMSIEEVLKFHHLVDIIQIGSRNMYNYPLLRTLGEIDKPVMLKRGFSATYEEWHLASQYIISNGNKKVILAERGIRTFETGTRNTLDITAIPFMKCRTGLPIVCDPSHAVGLREFVEPLAFAALATGADGLMIEVHETPEKALSDGRQSIELKKFPELMDKFRDFQRR